MDQIKNALKQVIEKHMPNRTIKEIIDKGVLVKHTFKIILDNEEIVYIKVKVHPEWGDLYHEKKVTEMLREKGLSAPRILNIDITNELIPYPYLIQEEITGEKLLNLLLKEDESELIKIYEAMGRYYFKAHSITSNKSGIWNEDPNKLLYPISPNDYMYEAEILNGSGKRALEEGIISQKTYDRIVSIWSKNLDSLKQHQPSLVNVSSFIWNIYLNRKDKDWEVTKVTALSDVIWWDTGFELALIKYPPFYDISNTMWEGFLRGYGKVPEEKRLLLYSIMQKLCAIMGVYMDPEIPRKNEWIKRHIDQLDQYLTMIELQNN